MDWPSGRKEIGGLLVSKDSGRGNLSIILYKTPKIFLVGFLMVGRPRLLTVPGGRVEMTAVLSSGI